MTKKYETLEHDSVKHNGKTLYRIKALIGFGYVKAGDLGGYVEHEDNLSHIGDAWIFDNAKVYDNAVVDGDAWVDGDAQVSGNAWVHGDAWVRDYAEISGNARVHG